MLACADHRLLKFPHVLAYISILACTRLSPRVEHSIEQGAVKTSGVCWNVQKAGEGKLCWLMCDILPKRLSAACRLFCLLPPITVQSLCVTNRCASLGESSGRAGVSCNHWLFWLKKNASPATVCWIVEFRTFFFFFNLPPVWTGLLPWS